jgi:hypothetical protein
MGGTSEQTNKSKQQPTAKGIHVTMYSDDMEARVHAFKGGECTGKH